jgi:serine protease Do
LIDGAIELDRSTNTMKSLRSLNHTALVAALILILAPAADAQWHHFKNHPRVRRAFRTTVDQTRPSTVRVLADGSHIALGAIVDKAGLVVTKASELRKPIACQLQDNKKYAAKIVAQDSDYDLALLRLEGDLPKELTPVRWREGDAPAIGSWLSTVDLAEDPAVIGVVSVAPREIEHQRGFLGVGLDETGNGPKINEVMVGSAAEAAGLKIGDVVTHVNGARVRRRMDMIRIVGKLRPGDTVRLRYSRDDEPADVSAKLGTPDIGGERASRFSRMNALGGKLSERRADFPSALQHDSVLKPNQCGGPLVDIDGTVAGINIARAGRTNSYAIPAAKVVELIQYWKNQPEHRVFFHDDGLD